MSKHLQQFAYEYMEGKPVGYLLALGIVCRGVSDKGRLSEKIRDEVEHLGLDLLKINVGRRVIRYEKFLQNRLAQVEELKGFAQTVKALRVKDFRGFGSLSPEDKGLLVNFNAGKNIFYAPNGGGKTSMCEALEYIFTGGLKEAERRRTKLSEYLKRGPVKPTVKAMLGDESVFQGVALIDTCFLDRNRLQEFSLLGSKDTNFLERDVLAALFGLEEIEELIGRFVQPRNFSLVNCRITRASVEVDRQAAIVTSIIEQKTKALAAIEADKNSIASVLGLSSYNRDDVAARLAFRKSLLNFKREKFSLLKYRELPQIVLDRAVFVGMRRYQRFIGSYWSHSAELMENVQQINFEDLFQSITNISTENQPDHCPACLTPLSVVAVDPFERARKELEKLSVVAEVRKKVMLSKRAVGRIDKGVASLIKTVRENGDKGIQLPQEIASVLERAETLLVDESLPLNDRLIRWEALFLECEKNAGLIAEYHIMCLRIHKEHGDKSAVYKVRQSFIEKLESELAEVVFYSRSIKKNRLAIEESIPEFAAALGKMRRSKALQIKENEFNELVAAIEEQYKFLLSDLREYKLKVEDSQIAGIEGRATEFYQKINEGDEDHEKVSSINFLRSDGGYRVALLLGNGETQDAFSCLSEGHLRTLGLSLLLAVAVARKYPFIVFDDVVNAIDAEHRANIVSLLFTDPYLSNVQQIITTHDRLFWERYCNAARRKYGEESLYARVLTCTNRGIVVSDYDGGFKRKILNSLCMYDIRQALVYCRIWFETMVAKYCIDNELKITAVFNSRQLKPNNYLEISLEVTYKLIEPVIAWDVKNYDIVKRDLVNWKGQNQEHHAFEEGSFNFVHSKTSAEVHNIFNAISRLEYQLFPTEFVVELGKEKADLEAKAKRESDKLGNPEFVDRAPAHIVAASRDRLGHLESKIKSVGEDLLYACKCADELPGGA